MSEILLNPREVGVRLGFKRTKVFELLRQLEASGTLPLIRHNARVVRVRERDLDRWINAGCPMPDDEA